MKKYILAIIVITCAISTYIHHKKNITQEVFLLENIEALARGEVEIPGVCAAISPKVCMVFSDGYFLLGIKVA